MAGFDFRLLTAANVSGGGAAAATTTLQNPLAEVPVVVRGVNLPGLAHNNMPGEDDYRAVWVLRMAADDVFRGAADSGRIEVAEGMVMPGELFYRVVDEAALEAHLTANPDDGARFRRRIEVYILGEKAEGEYYAAFVDNGAWLNQLNPALEVILRSVVGNTATDPLAKLTFAAKPTPLSLALLSGKMNLSLIPATTGAYSIGSQNNKLAAVHASQIRATSLGASDITATNTLSADSIILERRDGGRGVVIGGAVGVDSIVFPADLDADIPAAPDNPADADPASNLWVSAAAARKKFDEVNAARGAGLTLGNAPPTNADGAGRAAAGGKAAIVAKPPGARWIVSAGDFEGHEYLWLGAGKVGNGAGQTRSGWLLIRGAVKISNDANNALVNVPANYLMYVYNTGDNGRKWRWDDFDLLTISFSPYNAPHSIAAAAVIGGEVIRRRVPENYQQNTPAGNVQAIRYNEATFQRDAANPDDGFTGTNAEVWGVF